MKINFTPKGKRHTLLLLSILSFLLLFATRVSAQMRYQIIVRTVTTTIPDCDPGFFEGASDPTWSWSGGVSNNCYSTSCNGCSRSPNTTLYDQTFTCLSEKPASVAIRFEAGEDDSVLPSCNPITGNPAGGYGGGSANRTDIINLPIGTGTTNQTFSVTVNGGCNGNYTYTFDLIVSGAFQPVPGNDNACAAAPILTNNTQINSNNNCATVEAGEVDAPAGNVAPSNTVWYSFVAPPSGYVTVSTDHGATNFDTEIALWHAANGTCQFSNMQAVNSDDDITILINRKSEISQQECLVPGDVYYVQMDGDDPGETGNFGLTVQDLGGAGPAPNDRVCNAINLGTLPAQGVVGNMNVSTYANFCATANGDPNPGWLLNGVDQGVWFSFTTSATPSPRITIEAKSDPTNRGDDINLQLALYKVTNPTPCTATPTFTKVGDSFLIAPYGESLDATCLDPNSTYYILVDGYQDPVGILGGVQGYFGLEVRDGNLVRAGDMMCNAQNLGTVPAGGSVGVPPLSQSNVCATDTNDPTPGRWTSEQGVWYSFVAPPSGSVLIEAVSDNVICLTCDPIDIELAIYSTANNVCTNDPAQMIEFDSEYSIGFFDEDWRVRCLDPGRRYWLFLDGSSTLGQAGTFGFTITDDQRFPAPNDEACNAIPMGVGQLVLGTPQVRNNQNNFCADNVLEPTPPFGNEHSVWYTFVAPASGSVQIDANNLSLLSDIIDLQVAVFDRGTAPCNPANTFTLQPGADELFVSPLDIRHVVNCLIPGNTYYILVDGQASLVSPDWAFGEFNLTITAIDRDPAAPNDLPCAAIPLGLPAPIVQTVPAAGSNHGSQNNYCATSGAPEPGSNSLTPDQTVWYSFVAPSTTNVHITITTDSPLCLAAGCDWMLTEAAVYDLTSGTCGAGTWRELNVDAGLINIPPDWEADVPCLIPGRTYYVMVQGGSINNQGHFDIKIEAIPARPFPTNDLPCQATPLGNVFASAAGVTLLNQSNLCADNVNEPTATAFGSDHTVWYSFTTPATGGPYGVNVFAQSTTINPLAQAAIDPQLAVFEFPTGCANATTSYIEKKSEYDIVDLPILSESMDVHCLEPNRTYYIMLDGSVNLLSEGNYDLTVKAITAHPIAPNNLACQALNLGTINPTGTTGTMATNYTNFCADTEQNEPNNGFGIDRTVWFKFTTPNGGANMTYDVTARLQSDPNNQGENLNIQAAVYKSTNGCAFGGLQYIDSDDPLLSNNADVNTHCLDANTTYYIQVDGVNDPTGLFGTIEGYFGLTLEVTASGPRPNNDNACNAVALGTVPNGGTINNNVIYNNYCATTQAGEPDPNAFNIDKTVWFTFVAPASGNVRVQAFSQSNDPIDLQLAVYKTLNGCTFPMVEMASDYDGLGLVFDEDLDAGCLRPLATYYLQVDGEGSNSNDFADGQGNFKIKIDDLGGTTNIPYNNDVCNAYDFGTAGAQTGKYNETNTCADIELFEVGDGHSDYTVWYKFIAPPSGRVNIDLKALGGVLGLDSELHLYSSSNNTCTGTLNSIESNYFPSALIDEHIDADCLVPGGTYFIQVDGAGLIKQGNFDIKLEDALPNYATAQPANNDCANATTVPVTQGACAPQTFNYGNPTVSMPGSCNSNSNCGDTWYSFVVPANGLVQVAGDDDAIGGVINGDYSNLHINAYTGGCAALTSIANACASGGQGVPNDPDPVFELAATPGSTVYLQVFGGGDNDFGEDFTLCVTEKCGADNCANAIAMIPQQWYCWNTNNQTGESVAAGQGYPECTSLNDPKHSLFYKFRSDCNGDSLTLNIRGAQIGGQCLLGVTSTDGFSLSLFEDATPCDGVPTRVVDCQSFRKCTHPGIINWSRTYTGLTPNSDYILMIDSNVPLFTGGNDFGEIMVQTRGNPRVTLTSPPIVCKGVPTTITAHTQGGRAPFTFNWNNGTTATNTGTDSTLTNVTAGTYSVTATDARGCTGTATIIVTDTTTLIVLVLTQTAQPTCANTPNGAANAAATGGVPPYTYAWDNSITTANNTTLTAGLHTVTVTDSKLCTSVATINITGPNVLTVSAIVTNVACNLPNGGINITTNGGTPTLTYLWSNNTTLEDLAGVRGGTYTVTVTDANACSATISGTVIEATPLIAAPTATNVFCNAGNNGSATANASGGTPPYRYNWTNTQTTPAITGLVAGVYGVTVTDAANCTYATNITVTQPQPITVTMQQTAVVACFGECTATATGLPQGGTSPYAYSWNTTPAQTTQTAVGLCAGTYRLTVTDANFCDQIGSITIAQPNALTATATAGATANCGQSDGTATADGIGGTAPYMYAWDNFEITKIAVALPLGTHTVTVTDANGCTKTATVSVLETPPITFGTPNINNVTCNGACNGSISVLIATNGVPPNTYAWSNGSVSGTILNVCAGVYTITVTDSKGCSATASYTITEPPILSVNVTAITPPLCNGGNNGTAIADGAGGTPPYIYTWDTPFTGRTVPNLTAGTHTVTVTDANNCSATSSFVVTEPLRLVATINKLADVKCFNDTDGRAIASATGGTGAVTYRWDNNITTAINATLTVGTHTVTVTDANNCTSSATVIINNATPIVVLITLNSPVLCHDGTTPALASATGGAASYTYLWSDNTNIAANTLTGGLTYTVTATGVDGCTNSVSITLSNPNLMEAVVLVFGQSQCGAATGGATASGINGVAPYTFLWDNGVATATNNTLNAGTHTVLVTDANGCTAVGTGGVGQNSTLAASVQSTTPVRCNGQSSGAATILATGGFGGNYTYIWDGVSGAATNSALAAGTHTVVVSDGTVCTVQVVVNITQPLVLTLSASPLQPARCSADNGEAIARAVGGTPQYTFLWDNAVLIATNNTLSSGVHDVTVTDASGCTTSATVTIGQLAPLRVTVVATAAANCNQADGAAQANGLSGQLPYTFLWDNNVNTDINTTLNAGTHFVTITDATGCSASASINIANANGLAANLVSKSDVSCNASCNGRATIAVLGGTTPYNIVWSNANLNGLNLSSLCAGTYTATITDATACTVSIAVSITQPEPIRLVTRQVSGATCGDNGVGEVVIVGGTPSYNYLWDSGTPPSQNPVSGLSPTTHTVTVIDNNACTAVANLTIQNLQTLRVTTTATTAVRCTGQSNGAATAVGAGGTAPYTYAWDNSVNTARDTTLAAGTHFVTVTDATGCSTQTSVTILQPTPLIVNFPAVLNAACNGTKLGSISAAGDGGTPLYTYLWSTSSAAATISGLPPATYTVTVTDKNKCTLTAEQIILDTPNPLIDSISNRAAICFGNKDGRLQVYASSGLPTYTYIWSNAVATDINTNLGAGRYTVTVTDARGCITSQSATITQPLAIKADAILTPPSCYDLPTGTVTIVNIRNAQNIRTLTYGFDNGTLTRDSAWLTVSPGAHTVKLMDERGCEWTKAINMPFGLTTTVDAGADAFINVGDTHQLTATLNNFAAVTYNWFPATGLSCTTCKAPIATPLVTTTYIVSVTDPNGCTDTDEVTIQVTPKYDVYIPNIFTPNGDGPNDGFTVYGGRAATKINLMRIFDRWGQLVYEGKDMIPNEPTKGWNGTFKGQVLTPQVLVYYIEVQFADGTTKPYKGDVTLMR